MAIWNGLKEEVITATTIHKFKEMLDIWKDGDRTPSALLESCIIQLGKLTQDNGRPNEEIVTAESVHKFKER